ncbi:MAG: dihydroorotate dehydrogenase [Planctomycetes bacterium RIFCSPLOWO2_12_FULL_39_13]|nr:MAG: dihydroorotate dehydrogenase [Planctomycetes bacterium GWA2_39_15]OHB99390.1 MAG: dihydroorotate dehydrogenase [Planctomycetes bacterium RIFCSPLOWO2_12_FULL_39_13]
MSALIVGGDHLGSIPKELDKIGVNEVRHLTGRSGQKIRDGIPETMDFIIVLYDFVNHNLAYKIKKFAENKGIPIVYAKRSWASIYQKMKDSQRQFVKKGLQIPLN